MSFILKVRWRLLMVLAAIIVSFCIAAACGDNDDDDDDDDIDDDTEDDDDDQQPPNPAATHPLLDLTACQIQVPFPCQYFTKPDQQTANGIRLNLEKELPCAVDAALSAAEGVDIREAAAELDGFSTMGSILIPFSGALDLVPWIRESPGDRQAAGQGFTRLYDVTDANPVPLGHWRSFIEGQNVLVINPGKPMTSGHRILVCLVGPLQDADGKSVVRPDLFDSVMNGDPGLPDDPLIDDLEFARDLIRSGDLDIDEQDLLLAFSYWTGSGQSVLHQIRQAVQDLDDQTPILPDNIVIENPRTVRGSFLSPEFRDGQTIPETAPGQDVPIQDMVECQFLLSLPEDIDAPLYPVIYLHGLTGSRNDSRSIEGMAVFSTDAVLHGDRPEKGSDFPYPFIDLTNLRHMRDNVRQTAADHMAFARMIGHIAQAPDAYGLPDGLLATDTLAAMGESLGCINGAAFSSIDPEIDHLACIAGGGFFSNMTDRSLYGLFMPAALRGLPPFEKLIFGHLMQASLDPTDPAALSPGLTTDTPDERSPRNVLIIEAVGDRSVPNCMTEALAWGSGIDVMSGPPHNWYGLEELDLPVSGNIETGNGTSSGLLFEYEIDATPVMRHTHLFGYPPKRQQVQLFLQTSAETGIGQIIDPEAKK